MHDRRRARRDEEADEGRSPALRRGVDDGPETGSILDLQARAGNRAVAALLGTHEAGVGHLPVQRDATAPGPAADPATKGKTATEGTVSIPDLKLVVPLVSYTEMDGKGINREAAKREVNVMIHLDGLDPRVMEAAAKGRQFTSVTLTLGENATITLYGVYVANVSVGQEYATLTLGYDTIDRKVGGG